MWRDREKPSHLAVAEVVGADEDAVRDPDCRPGGVSAAAQQVGDEALDVHDVLGLVDHLLK